MWPDQRKPPSQTTGCASHMGSCSAKQPDQRPPGTPCDRHVAVPVLRIKYGLLAPTFAPSASVHSPPLMSSSLPESSSSEDLGRSCIAVVRGRAMRSPVIGRAIPMCEDKCGASIDPTLAQDNRRQQFACLCCGKRPHEESSGLCFPNQSILFKPVRTHLDFGRTQLVRVENFTKAQCAFSQTFRPFV
jgi:hypothetical protein